MLPASQQNSLALMELSANMVTQQLAPRLIWLELVCVTLHHTYSFNLELPHKECFNPIYDKSSMACASKRSDYLIIRVLLTILSVTKINVNISLAFK